MDILLFYGVVFVLIWTLALLFRKKLKIEVYGPLLMRKTKRMRGLIDRIAQKYSRFWKWSVNIGIPIAFFFMFYMLYAIIASLKDIFVQPQASLIVPGVDIPGSPLFVPLSYGLIGLVIVIVAHEFAHGILARIEGVKIKSIGLLLLAIIPGAFVEPDEDDIKRLNRLPRLRIYAAGSIANLIIAFLCLLVFIGVSSYAVPATFETDGIVIKSVVPGSPASTILKDGMVIKSINGKSTTNITEYRKAIEDIKIGEVITIETDQGIFKLKTSKNPNNASRAYIGIRSTNNLEVKESVKSIWGDNLPTLLLYLQDLFFWISILNFAVGTVNLLPAKPLDGGLMFEELLKSKLPKNLVNPIVSSVSVFVILVLALSIIWGTGRGILLMF
ncbi:MAG: site-2 protease family protein [Methanothermobacter sp.]